jgi:hypothetical protein
MPVQRKRYFADNGKWFCEVQSYYQDEPTRLASSTTVEVSRDEVPADQLPAPVPAAPKGKHK